MALKRKITKDEFEALPEVLKAEYKGDGAGYVLDTDDDNTAVDELRRALERVKQERGSESAANKALKEKLDKIQADIDAGILTTAEANKDVEKLKELFTNEREKLRGELTEKITKKDAQLQRLLLGGQAESLARELSGDNWALMLPHIKSRLTVDLSEDEPKLTVLTEGGQPSTLSLADLKAELLKNKLFAPILKGVDSSGGGAGRGAGGGGASKKPNEYTQQERTDLYNSDPEEYARLFPTRK